jgi:hypothetical protein
VLTYNVTGTFTGVLDAPPDATIAVPAYVPAVNPVGFALTLRLPGVDHGVEGVTLNHAPPLAVVADPVYVIGEPLLDTARI